MNLRQIEAFKAVMMTGTVTAAAELLHVSQPSISRLISDLERVSGLQLFVREKRRVHPTHEALTFYDEVQHAFVGLEALKKRAWEIRSFNTGQLRVTANPAMAMSFLPRVFQKFLSKHPNVKVSLQSQTSSGVKEWIAAQQFDLGLSFGTVDRSGISCELFADVNGVCVLSSAHRLADKRIITPQDLDGETLVSLGADDLTRHRIERVLDAEKVTYRVNIETQLAAVICSFVLSGVGVSIVNPFTAEDFSERGLVVRPFEPAVPIQFWLLTPTYRPRSTLADKLIAALKEERDDTLTQFRALGFTSR